MSDNDLIRRGDARRIALAYATSEGAERADNAIAVLPAVTVAAPTWQPIETAPKNVFIILWGRYWSDEQGWMHSPLVGAWQNERWEVFSNICFGIRPTQWMPLPATPVAALKENSHE